MADTYTLIQKITVSQATPSVTFSNIPQGYTDLVIHQSAMSDVTTALGGNYNIEFNGVTSGYSGKRLYADPSGGAASDSGTSKWSGFIPGSGATQNVPNSCFIYIPNYSSNNHKSWSVEVALENNNTNSYLGLGSNLWSNTAAITSITLKDIASSIYTGNFLPNSTFYLYGVTKSGVSTPTTAAAYATGGDDITTDGTYWIHTFRSSGTFTPKKALSNVDYLVVAGGGGAGGGNTNGGCGGGGAGGLRCTVTATGGGGSLESALSLAANTGYTVTIGAGGAGDTSGSNSVFSSITSTGGGGGSASTGANGGSGGGSGASYGASTGTPNQGYAGGTAIGSSGGSGGGGAGAVGAAASTSGSGLNGGAGGNGVTTSISGTSTTYAGGGGGSSHNSAGATSGAGGSGGGGTGSTTVTAATNGTSNTGGGGGGARTGAGQTRGSGGSGLVIVRYPV